MTRTLKPYHKKKSHDLYMICTTYWSKNNYLYYWYLKTVSDRTITKFSGICDTIKVTNIENTSIQR